MKNKPNFKIKSDKGNVVYAMRTGSVFVKSMMMLSIANRIVKAGKSVEISDKRGYGKEICVDDTYFFPVADEVTDNE